jgi:hypothetical protein
VGAHAEQAWRPIEPPLIASENAPVWDCLRELRGIRKGDAEDAVLEAAVDSKPCRMPRVCGPIDERKEQENDRPAVVLAKQAQAKFAALVVEKKQVARNTEEDEGPPHGGERLQEVISSRNVPEQERPEGDGAGPNADPEDCHSRFVPTSEEALDPPRQSHSDSIVRSRVPEEERLQNPGAKANNQHDPHSPPKQGFDILLRRQMRHATPPQ